MLSNYPNSKKNNSKDKNIKTKIPAKIDGDKEFIVFQFTEDGDFDLVKDKSHPRNQDGAHHSHKVQLPFFFVAYLLFSDCSNFHF